MVHKKGGRSLPLREKRGSRQMYDTETYRPSFPSVLVGKVLGKYRPIPNRNTESRCNSISIALCYGELLAYWFVYHGCFGLEGGLRPVLFHDSLARITTLSEVLTYVAEPPTRACKGGAVMQALAVACVTGFGGSTLRPCPQANFFSLKSTKTYLSRQKKVPSDVCLV